MRETESEGAVGRGSERESWVGWTGLSIDGMKPAKSKE